MALHALPGPSWREAAEPRVLLLFPQPHPTVQLPQLGPAWAAASKNRWHSNWIPLSKGGCSPAWHPLPLALANRCSRYSCPLNSHRSGEPWLYGICISDLPCSFPRSPQESSRLCRFPCCLLSSLEHQRVRGREGRKSAVLCGLLCVCHLEWYKL